jgi:serine/threonine protein kinase/tetratricopeptide (TPR) repeat protein
MGTAGNDDERLTPPCSTADDGVDGSSYNKTLAEGEGSTCEDDANDWERWVSVESTVEAAIADSDWQWGVIDFALGSACDPTSSENGHARDPDGTFFWDAQDTLPPVLESTVWPVGSSLLPSGNGRTETIAGFEIISQLGRGGMGIVYKARDPLKRLVALKVIRYERHQNEDDLKRLEIEALALGRLDHPNILGIYQIGKANGVPFVALELLEGGTLKDRLAGTPQPVREAATLLSTLARSLHAAHLAEILHRDLKPSNILFDSKGVPKIADFGLAKRLDVEEGETIPGQVIGTPSYMAPEQADGWTPEIGKAADIYALGAILYEMLTGRPPIKGATQTETLKLCREQDPVSPSRLRPKLPFDLETICLKCIERDPRKRYADALSLAEDLDRFLADKPIKARRTPLRERALKLARRHPVLTTFLAMGMVALGVGSGAGVHVHRIKNERIGRLVQSDEQVIWDAQRALAEKRWVDARSLVSKILNRIDRETDDRLRKLRRQAESLDKLAGSELDEQMAAEHAQSLIRDFGKARDEALFLDTRFAGLSPENSLEATCRYARAGLGVFGAGAAGDEWTLVTPPPNQLTSPAQAEIAEGFYELLLILADAVAQSPGAEPTERAEQALRIMDRARPVRSQPTRAFHLRRADYLEMKGDRGGAVRERDEAERAPAEAFDFFLDGRELARNEEWKAAITSFEAVIQKQADHFWAKCLLAISHLRNNDPEKARVWLTSCLQQRDDLAWLYLLRGLANAAEGGQRAREIARTVPDPASSPSGKASERFEAAEDDYRNAFERLGDSKADADLHYVLLVNRGLCRLERHDPDAAAADLQEAIRRNDRRFEAHSGLAHVLQRRSQRDEALKQLAIAIALQPNMAHLHRARADFCLGLADSSHDLRDVDLRLLEKTIASLTPGLRDAVHGDLEAAIRCESPGNPKIIAVDRAKQAALFHVAGRQAEALEACDAALEETPSLAFAHQVRINVLLNLARYDELLYSCDLAINSGTPTAALYELRGMVKDGLEDYSGAIDDYTQALALKPKNRAGVLCRRGWSYLAYDSNPPALHDFEEALALAPKNAPEIMADAYGGHGLAKARLGFHKDAVADADESRRLGATEWRITYNVGRVYAQAAVAVDTESRKTGPAAVRVVTQYREQARDLVVHAFQLAPAEQRPILRETIKNDPALKPIPRLLKALERFRFDPPSPSQVQPAPG